MTLRTYTRLVALVGRPNVGKSSLFNRIIRQRKSLVHDEPGVTRDRIFGRAEHNGESFYLCDTGGFEPTSRDNIKIQLVEQAEMAIEEAETVIFVVDGREGIHPIDNELIKRLRKSEKNFVVCVNKCDLPKDDIFMEEFRKLGVQKIFPVSAEHNRGISDLLDAATEIFSNYPKDKSEDPANPPIKLSIIGRPNVGKSSILNRLVGEARSIVDERPGTTRDAVDVLIKYHGRQLKVIDTAGIRRKSRMADKLEKFSAFRSVACLEDADVSILVINAEDGATDGDARVAGFAFELRKPILIVVNKWDLIKDKTSKTVAEFTEKLHLDLKYLRYAPIVFVSALENLRVSKLIPMCLDLYDQSAKRNSTSQVNNVLKEILLKHTPPLIKNKSKRVKFFYATQVGVNPPRFIIFCSHPKDLHFSYKRYVENSFREAFGYKDIPVSIIFRERTRSPLDENGERNKKSTGARFHKDRNYDDDIRSVSFDDLKQLDASDIEFYDDDSEE
ncbi:ribosome biogenesis GTPase Der [Spirobacillus cienkowskii]|jgi:GTP-binding protein|uniref:GTPase Der n=1 Tax=Spirobacillus cienkowskii TaxID=495820 RepID=A0A369KVS0_9BACT|nr:MAG: ribosome biogenesis GTPase Der [Spirobacillus cienkowskii]